MIHIFICDDDLIHQKRIENYNLFHNNRLILQGIFSSPEALLQYLPLIHTVPETTVFLLDIELQGRLSGLELGKKINETFPDSYLIFITGHRDLCYLTFELQLKTFDYIIKTDISFMERVVSCMDRLQATIDTKPVMARPYFTYRTGSTTNRILEDHIYYFTVSSNSHKVIMYTKYKNVDFYSLNKAEKLAEIEDIYRPYRPKRRTRATIAKEKGLEPLADLLFAQELKDGNIEEIAGIF